MSHVRALLQLHDLDVMLESASDATQLSRLRKLGLHLDGVPALERARHRLLSQLSSRWVTPYERALRRYGRGLVAVRDRVCQGCFITLPTSAAPSERDALTLCESCGRILYWR